MEKYILLLIAGGIVALIGIWGGAWLYSVVGQHYEIPAVLTSALISMFGVWVSARAAAEIWIIK